MELRLLVEHEKELNIIKELQQLSNSWHIMFETSLHKIITHSARYLMYMLAASMVSANAI